MTFTIVDFVRESNRIEGIHRDPLDAEIEAHLVLLDRDEVRIDDLSLFVSSVQPGAALRDRIGMNVRVGRHVAPMGGRDIVIELTKILKRANRSLPLDTPFRIHTAYETLHPFMDGNGRSGRALWLWQMTKLYGGAPLGFLHHFYYQTLESVGR